MTARQEKDLRDGFERGLQLLREDGKTKVVRVESSYKEGENQKFDSALVLVITDEAVNHVMGEVFEIQNKRDGADKSGGMVTLFKD